MSRYKSKRILPRRPPADRFWEKVHKTATCWLWTGCCLPTKNHPELRGHPQMYLNGRAILAHRFSWELHYGSIPTGLHVLHKCDTPPCVRPDHLFLGTKADNTADALRKKRLVYGEATCTAILTESQVRELRGNSRTESYTALGRRYSVSEATIRAVIHRKNWKWLP